MRRTLILCLFLLFGELTGNCATSFLPPLQPINGPDMSNYSNNLANAADPLIAQNSQNYPNISKIEKTIFGRTYANQNISARLSRIEKSLFTTTYPESNNAQRIDNIISNFNQINKYPNISNNELSKIEAKVLSQTFPQNGAERRIERLEQQLLGATQSGDLDSRYETIKIASKAYSRNNDNRGGYAAQGNRGIWKGISQALSGSMMGGTMTGFTPQIDPFNNFSAGYNNYNSYPNMNSAASAYPSGSGIYRGYRGNNGYRDSFQNYSSGTGVTILD